MSIILRDYQTEMVSNVRKALRTYRNVIMQAPTGSGKTAMAAHMLANSAAKGKTGFFICHRQELVDQTAKTFDKAGLEYGYIANGYPVNYFKKIQICSIDTLKNRLAHAPVPGVCIWDEAHHLRAAGWTSVHNALDRSYHIGLSATPQRLDGKGLDDRFDFLVPGPSVRWLIDNGYLADYRLFSVPGVDMSSVHTRMGKYVVRETEAAMDKPTITGNIVNHWLQHANGRLSIGFAASRKMSEKYAEAFRHAGIPSVHLDGETPKQERRNKLQAFARRGVMVVWNVGLFGEGFDIAANSGMDVTVGCMIDASPTQSLGAWLQRCGRALRPQDGHAIILDHSGNAMKHGMPCQDRQWALAGREETNKKIDESLPIRQCEECYHVHKPAPRCPECGYLYPVQHRHIDEIEGELKELDPSKMRSEQNLQQAQAKTLEKLKEIEQQRGHREGWAAHVEKARQEKKQLRNQLNNLCVGAALAGVIPKFDRDKIIYMKPKELKHNIQDLTDQLKQQPQFG